MGRIYEMLWQQRRKQAKAMVDSLRFQLAKKKAERTDRARMRTVFGVKLTTSGEYEKRDNELSDLDSEIDNLENQLGVAIDRERRSRGR